MRKLLFLLLILAFSLFTKAQQDNKLPSKASLKDGTTLNGFIKRKFAKLTPQQFELSGSNPSGNTVTLTPENTVTIEIADSIIYRSAKLKIYLNPIDNGSLDITPDEPSIEGPFFIERLIKGNVLSLYMLTDSIKTHYIIEDTSGNFQSLRYVKYTDNTSGSGTFKEYAYYKNQLLAYAGGNEKAKSKIMSSDYSITGMIAAVTSVNNYNTLSPTASTEAAKHLTFYPFAGAGIGLATMSFDGIPQRLAVINFSSAVSPQLIAGVEMQAGKHKNILASLFASFNSYSFTGSNSYKNSGGTTIEDKYELKASPLSINVMLNYAVINVQQIKFAVGAGYGLVVNNISRNSFTTTDVNANGSTVKLTQVPIGTTIGQYFFDADLFINKRLSFQLLYSPKQDFSSLSFSSFKNSITSGSVKLRF